MKRGVFLVLSCLIVASVFSGLAAAMLSPLDIKLGTSVNPTSAVEQSHTGFTLNIQNGMNGNESICHVTLTTHNFTVLDATSWSGWRHFILPYGVYWNTSTNCISNNSAVNPFMFKAESLPVSSDVNNTWEVFVANLDLTDTNTTNLTVDTLNDVSSPAVILVSPLANASVNETFICNATDNARLDNITFDWNFSGTFQADGAYSVSGTENKSSFYKTGLVEEESYVWNCLACDVNDNCAFGASNASVFVTDLVPPAITVVSPVSTVYNYSQLWFNVTLDDTGDWCGYDIGAGNVSMTRLDNFTFSGFDGSVPDGQHTALFYCNDTAGNMNSTSVQFTVDTADPVVTFLSPSPGDYLGGIILINISADSTGSPFNMSDGGNPFNVTCLTGSPLMYGMNSNCNPGNTTCNISLIWDTTVNTTDGSCNFSMTAMDMAGNTGTGTVSFTIDNTPPAIAFISNTPEDGAEQGSG